MQPPSPSRPKTWSLRVLQVAQVIQAGSISSKAHKPEVVQGQWPRYSQEEEEGGEQDGVRGGGGQGSAKW